MKLSNALRFWLPPNQLLSLASVTRPSRAGAGICLFMGAGIWVFFYTSASATTRAVSASKSGTNRPQYLALPQPSP